MIEIITAPEHKYLYPSTVKVFLAGGIQKCPEWQNIIISNIVEDWDLKYKFYQDRDAVIINPRRAEWLNEPGAAQKQIEWEFDMIEQCDIFTMYFSGGESDQPICMYELGRNLERMKQRFPEDWWKRIIITCDSGYKRVNDVVIQTSLATDKKVKVVIDHEDSIHTHSIRIEETLKYFSTWKGKTSN